MAGKSGVWVFYYLQGEDGDSVENPNAFNVREKDAEGQQRKRETGVSPMGVVVTYCCACLVGVCVRWRSAGETGDSPALPLRSLACTRPCA